MVVASFALQVVRSTVTVGTFTKLAPAAMHAAVLLSIERSLILNEKELCCQGRKAKGATIGI